LNPLDSYLNNAQNQRAANIKAFSTLNDNKDYVRGIDYSQELGRLFSISDDGIVNMFDLQ